MDTVNSDNNKSKWYAVGLHFECQQCGRCCCGPAEGYIWVSKPEIRLIARHLNMPIDRVRDSYLRGVGLRTSIIEDTQTHNCIFLQENHGRRSCGIYRVRPSQCRTWPFWPSNLAGPDAWNTAGLKCPGINRGPLYDVRQIESIMNNIIWWRNDEQ